MLNSEGLYKEFVTENFPNLITETNIEHMMETLSSKDPDQTITVKAAYENARKETLNGFKSSYYIFPQSVLDLKNCFFYSHGKSSKHQLGNYSDGNKYCSSLNVTNPLSSPIFKNDGHVQTFLDLIKSGKNFI